MSGSSDATAILTGLLATMATLLEKVPEGCVRDRVLSAVEAEAVALYAHVEGRQETGEAIAALGRRSLLEPFIAVHPRVAFMFQQTDTLNSRDWLRTAERDFLIWIDAIMPGRMFEDGHLLAEAARRDDPVLFEALAARHAPLEPFVDMDVFDAMNVIDCCGLHVAPIIARRLRDAMTARTETIRGLQDSYYAEEDLKVMAVMIAAGMDMSQCEPYDGRNHIKEVDALLKKTASAHGRMDLMTREASLESMISRHRNSAFFGLVSRDGVVQIAQREGEAT